MIAFINMYTKFSFYKIYSISLELFKWIREILKIRSIYSSSISVNEYDYFVYSNHEKRMKLFITKRIIKQISIA